ncbi:MAG: putative Ig domain-containing protein, partial [Proteobacteria bacterium]|nr:putative Ig domain-containing protein [Pseudomonadota bacterium]
IFTVVVSNATNTSVTWQVNGVTGGNATVGTISATGQYFAPATPPAQSTVRVTAVSVQDPTKSASANVTVSSVPPPTLSGTPAASVLVGQPYDFKPTASDPTGLTLTFSQSGAPAWMTLNTATGELSGTPAAADVGTSTIVLTASNGSAQAHLTFSVSVVQAATGSATVSWVAPTTRTDGTPLTNLAGFRVYYGSQQGKLLNRVDVTNATATSAVIGSLTSGTWYFGVTAVDASGAESSLSTVVSKSI